MAGYVKLQRSIWQDPDFLRLDCSAQRLYLLLISQPDITHVGVLPLMPGRWSRLSANTQPVDISADLAVLESSRFVVIDRDTEELLVRTYLVYDEAHKLTNGSKSLVSAHERVLSQQLRDTLTDVLSTVGVTLTSTLTVRVEVSQQPAASSQKPLTSSQQPHVESVDDFNGAVPHPAAAAALGMLVEDRCTTARNPDALRTALRRKLPGEYGLALAAHLARHPTATADELASAVLHLNRPNGTPPAPAWYADPHCDTCDGDGLANHAPEGAPAVYGPCSCRQAEPHPEVLATVTELRAVQ